MIIILYYICGINVSVPLWVYVCADVYVRTCMRTICVHVCGRMSEAYTVCVCVRESACVRVRMWICVCS